MNYQIITDEQKLMDFIGWLPELMEDECYYVALFARKKYHESAKNDRSQCARFTATSKDWLLKKIKQLEIPEGQYTNKDGTTVHQDALALYISANPRSFVKAQIRLLKKLADTISGSESGMNPSSMAMSAIQQSKSRGVFVDFDFDNIAYDDLLFYLGRMVNSSAYDILETRGGYHVLVDPTKVDKKYKHNWHRKISEIDECDAVGDNMVPIAGCTQGGFTPSLINYAPF